MERGINTGIALPSIDTGWSGINTGTINIGSNIYTNTHFSPPGQKYCVTLHNQGVNYTNLGQQEDLVNQVFQIANHIYTNLFLI